MWRNSTCRNENLDRPKELRGLETKLKKVGKQATALMEKS
jgi:hypothetical protein